MLEAQKVASDAADLKTYKSHWVDAPYVSYQYNGQSFVGDAFWKKSEEIFASRKPANIITNRTDWNFTIKGAAAFVTFTQKAENVDKKTTSETYEERYVEKVNGEWKMVNMTTIAKANPIKKDEEEAAIKAVIEKETQSWIDKDAEKRITCYANVPQAHSLIYHGRMNVNNGIAYSLNDKTDMPERIKATAASAPALSGFKNDKYLIRINGSSAMVHFTQILSHASGEQQNMYNERYLEKINGEWKIVYIGGVSYKP